MSAPDPYHVVEGADGVRRIVPDYAASRRIAAGILAREQPQPRRRWWQRLFRGSTDV